VQLLWLPPNPAQYAEALLPMLGPAARLPAGVIVVEGAIVVDPDDEDEEDDELLAPYRKQPVDALVGAVHGAVVVGGIGVVAIGVVGVVAALMLPQPVPKHMPGSP
jgi:hypothetical protein